MANKELTSRIQLRYDTWDKWLAIAEDNTKILNKGEVAVVSIPAGSQNVDGEVVKTPPVTLFKVGNGEDTFKDLQWLSALAADVHPWAKQTEDEFKTWLDNQLQEGTVGYVTVAQLDALAARVKTAEDGLAAEITARREGDAAILGTENDAATANTVYGAKAAAKAADDKAGAAAQAAASAQGTADEALGKANTAQSEVDALEQVVAGKADATALNDYYKISDADAKFATIEATNETTNGLRTDVDANTAAIEILNGSAETAGSVATQVKVASDAAAAADEKAGAAQEHSQGVAADLAEEIIRAKAAEEAAAGAASAAQTAADNAQAAADAAQADIDAFLAGAEQGEAALDTLKEIQAFLASDDGTVQTLLDDVAALKAADVTLQGNIDAKADQTALDTVVSDVNTIKADYLTSKDVLILNGGTAADVW